MKAKMRSIPNIYMYKYCNIAAIFVFMGTDMIRCFILTYYYVTYL